MNNIVTQEELENTVTTFNRKFSGTLRTHYGEGFNNSLYFINPANGEEIHIVTGSKETLHARLETFTTGFMMGAYTAMNKVTTDFSSTAKNIFANHNI